MGIPTHVIEYSSGRSITVGSFTMLNYFLPPLKRLGGDGNWYLVLYRLPDGMSYEQMRKENIGPTEYVQAAGTADKMAVEVRKPAGEQWGATWVRYGIGHPHDGPAPVDVPLPLPHATEMITAPEVFTADEAAEIFMHYHRAGTIPDGYLLRPIEGYTPDGGHIDLRDKSATT